MSKKKDEYLNISPWKFLYTLLFFIAQNEMERLEKIKETEAG